MGEANEGPGRKVPAPGEAVAWAYQQAVKGSEKFLLVTLALYASLDEDDRWTCWPSRRTLAANVGVSLDRVKQLLRDLEAKQLLAKQQRTRPNGSTSSLRYVLPVGVADSPPTGERATPQGGERATPPPEPPVVNHQAEPSPIHDPRLPEAVGVGRQRRRVTRDEAQLAVRIMDYWKAKTGVAVTSWEVGRSIVLRIREVPDWTPEQHRAVIDANLRRPWWEGAAPPTVLYGSGSAWESARARLHGGTSGPTQAHPDQRPDLGRVRQRDQARVQRALADAKQLEGE